MNAAGRAGLEAALEAAGLLDAWVATDGRLRTGEGGTPLHDTEARPRPLQGGSLADWLEPAGSAASGVPPEVVAQVLEGIACGDADREALEAWIAPDGRFRLGALAGAWTKPAAAHIGFAARGRGPCPTAGGDRRAPEAAAATRTPSSKPWSHGRRTTAAGRRGVARRTNR